MKKYILLLALLLWPALAEGAIRYASTTGSGSACTVISTPCTIATAISQTSAADTVRLLGGTYTTYLNGDTFNWPSGTGLSTPTIIEGNPGDTVIIRPASESIINLSSATFGAKTFIKFKNLILDGGVMDLGTQVVGSNGAQTNIEFDNITIRNAPQNNGWSICTTCTGWWIHDSVCTNLGGGYCIYQSSSGATVERNTFSNCDAYAIHNFLQTAGTASNNIYRFNTITNCGASAQFSAGAILARGSNIQFYGNLVYANIKGGLIIDDCVNCLVYNNTIHGNNLGKGGYAGIQVGNAQTATAPVIRNNIVAGNTGGSNIVEVAATAPVYSNNLSEIAGTGISLTQEIASIFVDTSINNFQLKVGSSAINAGTTAGNPAGNTVDINNTSRPQGASFDIGAFELAAPPTCPTNPHSLVASYSFDSVATDSSGNGFTATLASGAGYSGSRLLVANAGGATVADANLLDLCDGFTLSARINVPTVATDAMFIVKNPGSKFFIGMLANYCSASVTLIGGYSQTELVAPCEATPLATSTDIYVAVTYDGTTVRLYKNAMLIASAVGGAALDATTGTLQICTSGFSEHCPNGTTIDNVKIYTYAQSTTELTTDMIADVGMSRTVKVGIGNTLKIGVQ